jgi:hypothetical protein
MVRRLEKAVPFQIVGFYTEEADAKRCVQELNQSFGVQLGGQIFVETPAGLQPTGRTVMDLVRELGINEIHHGVFEIEPRGALVVAAPKIIVPR